jgi:hypothetical protein
MELMDIKSGMELVDTRGVIWSGINGYIKSDTLDLEWNSGMEPMDTTNAKYYKKASFVNFIELTPDT